MTIGPIKGIQAYQEIQKAGLTQKPQGAVTSAPTEASPFADMLKSAIQEVDDMQKVADTKISGLVTGKGGVTTHEAMIALEQADVAFQLMNQVRAKIVRAYEDVMRTQL
jgi:flagellar hook-basal body complex protein FliE